MGREKTRARRRGRRESDRRPVYIAGAALALGAVVAVILISALSSGGGNNSTTGTPVVPSPRPAAAARNGLVYGSANAPVTVTEYLDFQ